MKNLGRVLAILAGFVLGAAIAGSTATAGDYTISDCTFPTAQSADSTYVESPPNNPGFTHSASCPGGNMARATGNTSPGDIASYRYEAPQGTGFLGARFWRGVYDSNGVTSRFMFNNAGGADTQVLTGLLQGGGLQASITWHDVADGQPRSIFRGTLKCTRTVNPCGPGAEIMYEHVDLKMRDSMAPTATILGGSLFNAGTVSGVRTASIGGTDNGSGVYYLSLYVNDAWANSQASTCGRPGLRPCPRDPTATFTLDTSDSKFVNGLNKITYCSMDYATSGSVNSTCGIRYINVAK